ncbi:hypothetical protein H4S06_004693, partial [Coemansia sp. BCRC 34490]
AMWLSSTYRSTRYRRWSRTTRSKRQRLRMRSEYATRSPTRQATPSLPTARVSARASACPGRRLLCGWRRTSTTPTVSSISSSSGLHS